MVLPDKKTIIGINAKKPSTLVVEDIKTNKATPFGKHGSEIFSLLYHNTTETLFAGDEGGHLKQYKRGKKTESFTLVKDYGDIEMGGVICSAQVGGYAVFGGYDSYLVAINIHQRSFCNGTIKSGFRFTYTLQVCCGLDDKVYLSFGGYNRDCFSGDPNILDVTGLYKKLNLETEQNAQEANKMPTLCTQKDATTKSIKLKNNFDSNLLKEKKIESKSTSK